MLPPDLAAMADLIASSPLYLVSIIFLAALGFLVLLRGTAHLISSIWLIFIRPGKDLKAAYGSWAIVTGATDGIGRGFATELAKRSLNVVLVSRTPEKLRELAAELEGKYGIQARTAAIDFAHPDLQERIAGLQSTLAGLDIGVLVNNVGLSYPYPQYFHEVEPDLITALLRVNVEATTRLTHLVLPAMLAKGRGAIVNIGSGAATVLPSDPLFAAYAGAKGFVDHFSRTLYVEYKTQGIDVQCQAPLYVATKMSRIRTPSLTCPSAATYAFYALNWVGSEPRCTPYWAHSLLWWVVAMLPPHVMDAVRLNQNLQTRKRALAKEARKKQEQ